MAPWPHGPEARAMARASGPSTLAPIEETVKNRGDQSLRTLSACEGVGREWGATPLLAPDAGAVSADRAHFASLLPQVLTVLAAPPTRRGVSPRQSGSPSIFVNARFRSAYKRSGS